MNIQKSVVLLYANSELPELDPHLFSTNSSSLSLKKMVGFDGYQPAMAYQVVVRVGVSSSIKGRQGNRIRHSSSSHC